MVVSPESGVGVVSTIEEVGGPGGIGVDTSTAPCISGWVVVAMLSSDSAASGVGTSVVVGEVDSVEVVISGEVWAVAVSDELG